MFAGAYAAGHLVIVFCFAQVFVVDMPVQDSFRTGVGGPEDEAFQLAGKAFRQVKRRIMLGIDNI
jgi:hypothetical protein